LAASRHKRVGPGELVRTKDRKDIAKWTEMSYLGNRAVASHRHIDTRISIFISIFIVKRNI
jgi:hypothetical protein